MDRELRGIIAGSSTDARFREPPAAERDRQAVQRSAPRSMGKPGRRMLLSATELTWRARLPLSRHGRVIARAAALAVLIAASGGLARLSWLVVEQAPSRAAVPGLMRTAASPVSPAPGHRSRSCAGSSCPLAVAAWCWSPRGTAMEPAACARRTPGELAVPPELTLGPLAPGRLRASSLPGIAPQPAAGHHGPGRGTLAVPDDQGRPGSAARRRQ
jgi:hypothetical protein